MTLRGKSTTHSRRLARVLTILFLFLLPSPVHSTNMIIGGETTYKVRKGDSLELIGARLGVYWKTIADLNKLDAKALPPEGSTLTINTRKIVPKVLEDGIVVNIADRTLYLLKGGKLLAIPVGVGMLTDDGMDNNWKTSTGKFVIVGKKKDPAWHVPESIRMKMALQGKPIEAVVPPGPDNPLGRYALVTSIPGLLIHETIRPRSVYRYMSHGCIRVLPEHMEELFPLVTVGTPGEFIYEPVKVAVTDKGKIYLEVRTDAYKKVTSLKAYTRMIIDAHGFSDKVDWVKVYGLVKTESGVATDVTLTPEGMWRSAQGPPPAPFEKILASLRSLWR
jgi:L,D-transpeptidase ErfK/SrfK